MNTRCDCLQSGLSLYGANILTLDYYDGPVSGIAVCSGCNTCYSFNMLDWTDDHRYRLYVLFSVEFTAFESFKHTIEDANANRSGTNQADYVRLRTLLHPKSTPDALVVWDNSSNAVYSVSSVPTGISDDIWIPWMDNSTVPAWFSLLNISLPT